MFGAGSGVVGAEAGAGSGVVGAEAGAGSGVVGAEAGAGSGVVGAEAGAGSGVVARGDSGLSESGMNSAFGNSGLTGGASGVGVVSDSGDLFGPSPGAYRVVLLPSLFTLITTIPGSGVVPGGTVGSDLSGSIGTGSGVVARGDSGLSESGMNSAFGNSGFEAGAGSSDSALCKSPNHGVGAAGTSGELLSALFPIGLHGSVDGVGSPIGLSGAGVGADPGVVGAASGLEVAPATSYLPPRYGLVSGAETDSGVVEVASGAGAGVGADPGVVGAASGAGIAGTSGELLSALFPIGLHGSVDGVGSPIGLSGAEAGAGSGVVGAEAGAGSGVVGAEAGAGSGVVGAEAGAGSGVVGAEAGVGAGSSVVAETTSVSAGVGEVSGEDSVLIGPSSSGANSVNHFVSRFMISRVFGPRIPSSLRPCFL